MLKALNRLLLMSYRQARRWVVLIVGLSVVIVGVLMIVLPGPAIIVIPLGLAILATEFVWAARLLRQLKQRFSELTTKRKANSSPSRSEKANDSDEN